MSRDEQSFRKIDELADRSGKRLFSLSPNDVLVQISLPLVLILAIATRLMILSQSMAVKDKGPAILDLWKQQLILRIDKVMDEWEDKSQYSAFPEFSRVQWNGSWPADRRFSVLNQKAQALSDVGTFSSNIYFQALSYQPKGGSTNAAAAYLFDIYDPVSPRQPDNADEIPPEFRITPQRREYALQYIRKRSLEWKQHVEDLQWSLVAACAERSPLSDNWSDSEISEQMKKLAEELKRRGYPLLPDVTGEYYR
jgi:hypothetical protein